MKNLLRSVLLCLCVLVFSGSNTYAELSQDDRRSLNYDAVFYSSDPVASCTSDIISGIGTDTSKHPVRFPVVLNDVPPEKIAAAIDKFIAKKPSSPFNGLGKYFVAGGKSNDINPLLAVGHLSIENGLGTAPSGWHTISGSNNAFGRTATSSQPHVKTGSGRKVYSWSSWQESLSGSDNWFVYIDRKIDKGEFPSELSAYINKYAPPSENDTQKYIKNTMSVMDEIMSNITNLEQIPAQATNSTQSETPAPTSSSSCNNLGNLDALSESEIIKHVAFSGNSITPTAVVLHWTAGNPNATVEEFVSSIRSNKACGAEGCAVQLYIDGSGRVYQLVSQLNTLTSHAGGINSKAIGIEIAAGSDGTVPTATKEINSNEVQKRAVARTVAYLMQKYNIQLEPDLGNKKGILSHHIVSPGRKYDVGDTYHRTIIDNIKNAGSSRELPAKVRPVDLNFNKNVTIGKELASGSEFNWGSGVQFQCLYELYHRESGWNERADNPKSNAYGIPQSLPGSKMSSEGSDWRTNPATQIRWGLKYIKDRYGTPCKAIEHHNIKNWY